MEGKHRVWLWLFEIICVAASRYFQMQVLNVMKRVRSAVRRSSWASAVVHHNRLVDHGGPLWAARMEITGLTLCHDFFWARDVSVENGEMAKPASDRERAQNAPIKLHCMCQDLLGHQSRENP